MKVIGIGPTRIHTVSQYEAARAQHAGSEAIPFEIQLPTGEISVQKISGEPSDRLR
jgi:hypothetical protein